MRFESFEWAGAGAVSAVLAWIWVLLAPLLVAAPAQAQAAPAVLWEACNESEQEGSEKVQCVIPRGVAANPDGGHVFVGDQSNRRIVEFNAAGRFVRAWGWDVVASGPGNDTIPPEDQFEVCEPAAGDECQAGDSGSGPGQVGAPMGMAVDSEGSVFVVDLTNRRVQKFDRDGEFALMFGGGVNQGGGSPESPGDVCTKVHLENGDACGAGATGTGPAEFGGWSSGGLTIGDFIAIDHTDKVWVGDTGRIQRFDTDGSYVADLPADPGAELGESAVQSLDVDSAGNLYAIYKGKPDVRKLLGGTGEELESPRFEVIAAEGEGPDNPTALAVDAEGSVYAFGRNDVGSGGSIPVDPIHKFNPAGGEVESFGKGEFNASTGMAANICAGSEAPGNLYVSNSNLSNGFLRAFGSEPIGCFKARTLQATEIEETAARLNGTVNPDGGPVDECRFEYGADETYGSEIPCAQSPAEIGEGTDPEPVHADLGSLEKGTVYHFRLRATVGGEDEVGADEQFKTLGPPVISADRTVGVTQADASVKALVNPEGFETTYHVEYTTEAAFEASGFEGAASTPPTFVGDDRSEHIVAAVLEGLEPGTAYRWRVVAENSSDTTPGEAHVIATYLPFEAGGGDCPNRSLRTGASAALPDCRAYEMVSPVDKNGGEILSGVSGTADPGGWVRSTPGGEKITYTAAGVFADQPNAFQFNQYLAERGTGGWGNRGIHPPVPGDPVDHRGFGVFREFMAFTADLCSAWFIDYQRPSITADGQPGYADLYRRDNCGAGAGSYEPLAPFPPSLDAATPKEYVDASSVQGVSEDGRHVVFLAATPLPLVPGAAEGFDAQVYDRFGGENHLVSVLPGGWASETENGVGSGGPSYNLRHALAADGAAVYWASNFTRGTGQGKLRVRLNPERAQSALAGGSARGEGVLVNGADVVAGVSTDEGAFAAGQRIEAEGIPAGTTIEAVGGGSLTLSAPATRTALASLEAFGECTEPAKACTVPVSAGGKAFFQAAAADGSKALYREGGELYEFDLAAAGEGDPPRLVAGESEGVAGVSEDLSHIYFISREDLAAGAAAGEPNLYLQEDAGAPELVARLVEGDVGEPEPGAGETTAYEIGTQPYQQATRVTPDGERIVFQSRARLTGYDNRDVDSGEPATEVYSYGDGDLICVSCNPSGARPQTRELPDPYNHLWASGIAGNTLVRAAGWIATWEHPLYASNVMSADGTRIFFNSNDPLLPHDSNGAQDVYEWEAPGKGSCATASPSYFAGNGGCLYLLSGGASSYESEFWEASASGDDVFFTTEAKLLPQDPGSIDLYDARVGGGFPQPAQRTACEGGACQDPPPPPEAPTPASANFNAPGAPPGANPCARRARQAANLSRRAKRVRRAARRAEGKRVKRRRATRAKRLARAARRQSNGAKRCRRAARRGGQAR